MKEFLQHLYICLLLWKLGFHFSKNIHSENGYLWGFLRLNYHDVYGLIDIDFDEKRFCHVHGGQGNYSLFYKRLDNQTLQETGTYTASEFRQEFGYDPNEDAY